MTGYGIRIEVREGEVKEILDELEAAQEKIYECYGRLQDLGVVTVSEAEKTAPEEPGKRQEGERV